MRREAGKIFFDTNSGGLIAQSENMLVRIKIKF